MDWYTSTILNTNNYTFGSSTKKELIVNSANFYSNYSSSLKALTTSYSSPPKINGTGYLSVSTWYTPTAVINFSANYSYETSNGAKITPIYIMVGNVDNTGKSYKCIDKSDTEKLSQYLLGSATLGEEELLAADVDNNGKVDLQDAISIEKFVSGSIKHF